MAGLEVAGVVLGAFPLLIEGLKQYQHGLETTSHMLKYEKTIADLILTFRADALVYTSICEKLVQPLMLDSDVFSSLIDDPRNGAWKDQDLGNRLKEILDKDFMTFVDLAGRLNDRLIKFSKNLDLDPANDFKPRWLVEAPTGQSKFREKFFSRSSKVLKGLKAGFDNGSLEKALDKVEEDLRRLRWLLDSKDTVAPLRQRKTRSGQAGAWKSIRAAACSVYNGLAAHWQCSSAHQHTVSLKLETRKLPTSSDDQARFGLILDLEDGGASITQAIRHDIEIEPKSTVTTSLPQVSPPTLGPFKISSLSATPPIKVCPPPVATPVTAAGLHIQDLCNWQQTLNITNQGNFGFLKHDIWRYDIYCGKLTQTILTPLTHLTLYDCLTGNSAQSSVLTSGLGPKEKIQVASVLASSLLQLGETPWLSQRSWTMEEIFLLNLGQRAQMTANPYIRRVFSPVNSQSAASTTPAIENELVFAFGVMLVELSYAKPLSHFKLPSDGDHPYTNLQIACRLVRDLDLREGEKYASVASRCIKCHFDAKEQSFDKSR